MYRKLLFQENMLLMAVYKRVIPVITPPDKYFAFFDLALN